MLGKAFSDQFGSTIALTSFAFCDFDRFKIAMVQGGRPLAQRVV